MVVRDAALPGVLRLADIVAAGRMADFLALVAAVGAAKFGLDFMPGDESAAAADADVSVDRPFRDVVMVDFDFIFFFAKTVSSRSTDSSTGSG